MYGINAPTAILPGQGDKQMNLHKKVRNEDLEVLHAIDIHTPHPEAEHASERRGATEKCVAAALQLKSLSSDHETLKESFDRLSMHGLVSCRLVRTKDGYVGMWTSKPAGRSLIRASATI